MALNVYFLNLKFLATAPCQGNFAKPFPIEPISATDQWLLATAALGTTTPTNVNTG